MYGCVECNYYQMMNEWFYVKIASKLHSTLCVRQIWRLLQYRQPLLSPLNGVYFCHELGTNEASL